VRPALLSAASVNRRIIAIAVRPETAATKPYRTHAAAPR
jgi:hypothetical protein